MSQACSPTSGVVVTGGASGIGLASAHALAEAGRPVALWDRNGDGARLAAAELAAATAVPAVAVEIDVSDTAALPGAASTSREALGSVGGLVHAAGIPGPVPVDALDDQAWATVLDVNLRAAAMATRALLADLRAAGPGAAIVVVASIEAHVANAAIPAYCASKAGLLGLTRSLALALAPDGIRVNAVCPGFVDTPMFGPVVADPKVRAAYERRIPLGHLARPDDIGAVVRFLLSDDARYVTGTDLVVDGGATIASG